MEREKCGIKVAVLDLTKICEEVKAFQTKKDKDIIKVETDTWGIVTTQKGVFALTIEGVGPNHPITNEDFLTIDFRGEYEKDGEKFMDMLPFATRDMGLEELQKCLIIEEKPLYEFIRTFGGRLEQNYRAWKNTLIERR